MNRAKSYEIPKRLVFEAHKQVKTNKGAEEVGHQSLQGFEVDLVGNLSKLWNRMSSEAIFLPRC